MLSGRSDTVIKMNERPVKIPNLPENRVSRVLVSGYKPRIITELKKYGINTMTFGQLESISGSEGHHADMSFCHTGGNDIFLSCNASEGIKQELISAGFVLHETEEPASAARPLLNICIVGRKVLANTRLADKSLLGFLTKNGHTIIHTNQGYTKCSSAVIGHNALITSDEGIYKACFENDIDVLKISSGYIELDGYKYGFIGGCCGFISHNTLAFSGNIELHPDFENMRSFAKNHNTELVSLSDEPLYDIGGILPISEYSER